MDLLKTNMSYKGTISIGNTFSVGILVFWGAVYLLIFLEGFKISVRATRIIPLGSFSLLPFVQKAKRP